MNGSADEAAQTVRLTVQADKPCEVLAWWPEAWGQATVEIKGAEAKSYDVPPEKLVTYGAERFARIPLPAGESVVAVGQAQ